MGYRQRVTITRRLNSLLHKKKGATIAVAPVYPDEYD